MKMLKKTLFITLGVIAALMVITSPAKAQTAAETAVFSAVLKTGLIEIDPRPEKLAFFLKKNNSPLTAYAGEFIKAADTYNLDWRLVPAITGVESTFGKRIPYNSYNAYGWNNGVYKFTSWSDSIWYVSKALREKYLDRGADTVLKIGRIYAPPSPTWAEKVNTYMAKINQAEILKLTL